MKNTQPHLEFPTPPPTVERGVLLPAPVLSRIGALFSSSLLPPTSICTGILSPKFCLKLELVKGLLEFHGNLLWFEGMTQYFPSLIIDQECGYWVQRWIMISGLSPPPQHCQCFGFGVSVRCEAPFLGVYRGPAVWKVSCWAARSQRSTGLPLESCLSCGP